MSPAPGPLEALHHWGKQCAGFFEIVEGRSFFFMESLMAELLKLVRVRLSRSQRAMVAAHLTEPKGKIQRCRMIYRSLEIAALAQDRKESR